MCAAHNGNNEVVDVLIYNDADVNHEKQMSVPLSLKSDMKVSDHYRLNG